MDEESQLIKRRSCHNIEPSQLIFRANQFTGSIWWQLWRLMRIKYGLIGLIWKDLLGNSRELTSILLPKHLIC